MTQKEHNFYHNDMRPHATLAGGTVLLAWSGKLDRQEEHNFYHNNETPLVLYFHTPCDNADGV